MSESTMLHSLAPEALQDIIRNAVRDGVTAALAGKM